MRSFPIKTEEQGQRKFHLLKGPREAIVKRKTGVKGKRLHTSEPISQKKKCGQLDFANHVSYKIPKYKSLGK